MNFAKIFNILRKTKKISYEKLCELGMNDTLLNNLIDCNVLTCDEENNYIINDVEELIYFGRYLLEKKEYAGANEAFTCAYETDPTNYEVNYQLFYRCLIKDIGQFSFKHFDVIYDNMKKNGRDSEANYYLFLLGNLYELPEKYKYTFDTIELDDMLVDNYDKDSVFKNKFRKYIFLNSYFNVNKLLDEKYNGVKSKDIEFEDKVEKELVLKWLVKNRNLNKSITELLKKEDYDELKNILDKENEHRFLSTSNKYLLKLVNSYIEMKNTGIVPEVMGEGSNTYEAIDNNNYKLAIRLLFEHNKEKGVEKASFLHDMLSKMATFEEDKDIRILIDAVAEMRKKHEIIDEKNILTDKEKQSLKSKIDELHNGRSAFLLEPMPKKKRDLVQGFVSKFEHIASFSIGVEPERRVVLRHHPHITEYVDRIETSHEAKDLYRKGKYEEAAKLYELLLKLGRPKEIIYGMYGLTLLRLNKRNEALDYLKIATIMSKDNGGVLDYSGIIESIEYPQDRETRKPKVEVKENEFKDENKSALSEELLNDLIGLTQEGEISLVDACVKLGLSEEDINYVKLLYARDCYYLNYVKEGDLYFKQVEKSKAKDKRVKDLYKEILRDKKYYHNRLDSEKNQLIFIKK